jgi:putative ABC transport system permease protein
MGRLAWSQLRFQPTRLIALLAGMLLATTAFTVLTAASRTSQLRTVGTVSAHFVPAYDILVRPKGARTRLETQTGTVQPNFLSGIDGGISMARYRQIQQVPGVQVAAPIAMVGYTLLVVPGLGWPLPAADFARPGRQLYRIGTTWVSDGGSSRISQPASYVYITPRPVQFVNSTAAIREVLPDGSSVPVCSPRPVTPAENPFGVAAQSGAVCSSKVNGQGLGPGAPQASNPGWGPGWVLPVLIAAVDPAAEAKLDGLDHAVISGRYLTEDARDGLPAGDTATFPVLAASDSGMDEYALTQLQTLAPPKAPPDIDVPWLTKEATVPGRTLVTKRTTAQQAYQELLHTMSAKTGSATRVAVLSYWGVGPASYRRSAGGALTPLLVHNPASVWDTGLTPLTPVDDADNQYRVLTVHAPSSGGAFTGPLASPQLIGIFNPAKVKSFDPLSQVPLGVYQPVAATPVGAASRKALTGSDLLPNQNLGGYVSQPVDLITTLSALPVLQNAGYYGQNLHSSDPISVIRVRVAGVTGPNAVSLERIREVAQQIAVRTDLDVDIVAGSSPSPTTIDLPAGKFGQPSLTLSEGWVKKGVAVAILTAVDKNSLVLFTLILIVCVLFVANSASAAIRVRRRELGVLACLGWTRPRLFTAVLGELAAIGLTAGILGAAAALPLSSALGLHASPGRAAQAVPIAVAVAVIAGMVPAWLAARADPVASVRPPVLAVRRAHQPGGITALAAVNVLRTPGRALVGAISLAVGVTALTMLTAVTVAFRGVLVGSLLGNAVAVQVRGVDYVAVAATVALGVLAVADVVFLNIRERAAELAVIRMFGWRESALSRLVVTEGVIIGLTGSLAGAALGLAAAANFAGQLPPGLYVVAGAAVAAGALVTAAAALLPAQALRRLPAAHLLAEE